MARLPLSAINSDVIDAARKKLAEDRAPSTVNRYMAVLRAAVLGRYNVAERSGAAIHHARETQYGRAVRAPVAEHLKQYAARSWPVRPDAPRYKTDYSDSEARVSIGAQRGFEVARQRLEYVHKVVSPRPPYPSNYPKKRMLTVTAG